jgi:cytidine deaminase
MTLLDMAMSKAKQSTCRYKIAAIGINKKGEVIGSSINKPRFDRLYGGLHAEVSLIRQYKRKLKTIVICRVGNSGRLLPIDPCIKCRKLAEKFDIKIASIRGSV